MSFDATVHNVMIASPGDVDDEKRIARDVIVEWNAVNAMQRGIVLLPVAWETHSAPAMGAEPQAIINDQLLQTVDLLVGIFWTRIGTATSRYPGGTVEEFEEHLGAKKPAMLYFSTAPVRPDSVDPDQYKQLRAFRESLRPRGLFETFDSPAQFREKFSRQLQLKVNQDAHFKAAPVVGDVAGRPTLTGGRLSREALLLLKHGSLDEEGRITRADNMGGTSIYANGQTFVSGRDKRGLATWDSALHELETSGYIEAEDYRRDMFRITRRGYQLADATTLS